MIAFKFTSSYMYDRYFCNFLCETFSYFPQVCKIVKQKIEADSYKLQLKLDPIYTVHHCALHISHTRAVREQNVLSSLFWSYCIIQYFKCLKLILVIICTKCLIKILWLVNHQRHSLVTKNCHKTSKNSCKRGCMLCTNYL